MSLNGQQETFCQLMSLGTINQTEAYRRAGYSPNGARHHASRLVTKGNIKARIAELRAELAKIVNMDREQFIKLGMEHRRIALAKDDVNAANGALSLVGKACALLTDKVITEESAEQKELAEHRAKAAKEAAEVLLKVHRRPDNGQKQAAAG